MSKTEDFIIEKYLEFIKNHSSYPTYTNMLDVGITRDQIRYHYGNINGLKKHVLEHHSDTISKFFTSLEEAFATKTEITKKRLVITTAVADSKAHRGFLDAIDLYCQKNDAQVIIMPCESVTNSFERKEATFDPVFSDPKYTFVTETIDLNNNLTLASIQVSAKQIKPTTGLTRIGQRDGSYVFAAPKQFLEYVPSGHTKGKNYAIMTPGACTLPSYHSNTFVSKRLSYIAHHDHTIGAIIVELIDDKLFHFRQIQGDADGSFYDLGKMYTSSGEVIEGCKTNLAIEIHVGQTDEAPVMAFHEFIRDNNINVDKVFIHDIFDGHSINHHISTIGEKSRRSESGRTSLREEIGQVAEFLQYLDASISPSKIYIVKSNHDEFLDRYLREGRYIADPENHLYALHLAIELLEGNDPLAMEVLRRLEGNGLSDENDDLIRKLDFLSRDISITIGGVEMAAHGDLGLNGARASLPSLEKIYGNCVVGHAHSAAIQRGVFRIGTFTILDQGYNRGPSSWTQTACLIYENGQRQLVNYVSEADSFCLSD